MPNDNFHAPQQDDWSSNPYDPGSPQALIPDGDHPMANNTFDLGYFFEVLKLTFLHIKDTSILKAILVISSFSLAWGLFIGVVQSATHFIGLAGILGFLLTLMGVVFVPIYILVFLIEVSLMRPLSNQLHAPQDLGGPMDVIKSVFPNLLMAMVSLLLLGLIAAIGTLFCVLPGLAALFFFYQAPYLIIVHDRSISDGFSESFNRAKSHWHVLLIGYALSWLVGLGLGVTGFIKTAMFNLAGTLFAPIAYLGNPIFSWVITVIGSVIGLAILTASCAIIDELEGIRTIRR